MRKSSLSVPLTILLAIAAGACNEEKELKHCVDKDNVVVDESNCATQPNSNDSGIAHNSGGRSGFLWYYGGVRSPIAPGGRISGGSNSPSAGKSYTPPSSFSNPSPGISRGGFGGSGGEGTGG